MPKFVYQNYSIEHQFKDWSDNRDYALNQLETDLFLKTIHDYNNLVVQFFQL